MGLGERMSAAPTHCCDRMRDEVTKTCDQHSDRYQCPDMLVDYSAAFREYGLIVHDGGSSVVIIAYCPWCGTQLPGSLRGS